MGAKEQIQGYFAFNDEDLSANKMGVLSEKQREKYPQIDGGPTWWVLFLGVGFLGLTIWRGYVLVSSGAHWSGWIWVVILLLVSAWLFRAFFNPVQYKLEMVTGEVRFNEMVTQTGSVTDSDLDRYDVHSYDMWVGGTRFSNANQVLKKYMEGEPFNVYYLSPIYQILSVEKSPP